MAAAKRKRSKQNSHARNERAPEASPVPGSHRRWFRLVALISPLLLLALLEFGLRLAGYGFPTSFFLTTNDHGRATLSDNPKYGWRFFPPAVARAPRPLYLSARKPPGTVRIFVFGESAAMGDPEPAYGFARQLERLLEARHPEQKIEVINAAMTAINSHVMRQIARDCAPHEGDFWLVLAGNNEVIGPFGAGTIFGRQAPNLATVQLMLALKTTRVGQLLASIGRSQNEPANWEGLEFFLKWPLAQDSPRLRRVYSSFGANLGEVAALGRRSGATVLLATVPVNLRDCPPFASLHRPGLSSGQLIEFGKLLSAGRQARTAGNLTQALSDFGKAAEIDDGFAQLAFERATCESQLGQSAPADTDFRRARDLDALRFRADTRMNQLIRQTAQAKATRLVDAAEAFAREGKDDLFYDHVHFNFTGNYRLALLFGMALEKDWPGAQTNTLPWLTEAEVGRRLAYTGFDARRVGEEMRARLQQPPFNSQSNYRARDEHWRVALAALSAPPANYISNYQAAIALGPEDWLLRANFARLLQEAGKNSQAVAQWAEVSRLLPHSPEGWANLGRLAELAGDTQRATGFLQEALKQQPDSVEARTEFGILEASLGHNQSAQRQFHRALHLRPGDTAARVNLGLLLAHAGDFAGAKAEYLEALRWQTNSVGARINLANLLAAHGQTNEALQLYQQAVALEPEDPVVRYNFGRVLAAQDDPAGAITNLQVALQQRPDMGEIHYEYAQALARLRREAEALDEFAQAVRLKPELPDAHLNYGVALARSRRYSEAAAEFQETLRLRPGDEGAQHMLAQAARLARQGGINH
ncbi:MAG TPA: tetratricopeptide repeat protein [Verrucomicrobiae bacterium]|nr:tetratricopeptide repeat protein [Verrucomicrobiae bacterium]